MAQALPFAVITPTTISDSNFVSSTVPETDYAVYSAGTTYALGNRRIVTSGYHKIYESLVDGNLGNFPPDNPDKWVEVGPTNRWAAFDSSGGTATTSGSNIVFVLTGSRIDSMAFLEISASSIQVQASSPTDGLGTYYDQTYTIDDIASITDWFAYFFAEIVSRKELIVDNIPPITNSTYTITVTPLSGGSAALGVFVMGNKTNFGSTQYGAKAGIRNYGNTQVDAFGRTTFVRRSYAKTMDVEVWLNSGVTDAVHRKLAALRDTPAVYIASQSQFDILTIYGRYVDFSVTISYPTTTVCSLQIEGLV